MSASAGRHEIIWVGSEARRPGERLPFDPERQVLFLSEGEVEERARKLLERGIAPLAAIIDYDTAAPLRVARQLHQLFPVAHLLFIVEQEQLSEFRSQMSVAPMIGTHWNIVDPRPEAFEQALQSALSASRQRRHLRTSLDAINLRLRSDRPPPDSAEYRKLVISDKYLATILEHAQDAIISLEPSGRVVTWNRGAVSLFGYRAEAVGRLTLEDLVAPEYRQLAGGWLRTAASGSPVVQQEVQCRRSDTLALTAEVTFAPIFDDLNAVVAVSLTARDITARKRDEEELRRIRTDLEERVAQRTALLRSVNRELEAFTYSASHDLRAPLRGIDGFAQALLEDFGDALDETAGRYLERIRSGARRMGEIIDALLMLSRISQAQLDLCSVDLSRLSHEILGELRDIEPGRRVESLVDPELSAHADPRLIRVALENLLGNAWKFTRDRDPAVIEVGRLVDREEPTFYVRDNGAGFDMSYGEKLFLPFQRLHHPLQFEGTGIGLGTVQRVINRHGGRVWAHGVPDGGATFYFTLPAERSDMVLTQVERPA